VAAGLFVNKILSLTIDANVFPILPKFTREFPRTIEFLLPLRMSSRSYRDDGGVVTIFDASPETDENQGVSGEIYAMTLRPAIVGHAAFVKPSEKETGFMQVREPVYEHRYVHNYMEGGRKNLETKEGRRFWHYLDGMPPLQYLFNISSIPLQYLFNTSSIPLQYPFNTALLHLPR
jgi:hypothetical protein